MSNNKSFEEIIKEACELRCISDKRLRKKYGNYMIII